MKYKIEGNIDFFSELYKSLDVEDNQNKIESDNNLCLITNQQLTDKFVELNCSHKFNYIPLYNDIYNHKQKFNNMEGNATSLKVNEIRCPYCRKKHQGVLPYYSELISAKINGVNFYDDTIVKNNNTQQNMYSFGKCEFTIPPIIINSQTVNGFCTNTYVTKSVCDNKTYCWSHNRFMTKKLEKEKKDKEKEAQKKLKEEAKQKAKDEKNKIKEEAKQKEKEYNLLQKQIWKKNALDMKESVIKITKEMSIKKAIKKALNKSNDLILSITDVEEENVVVSSSPQIETPTQTQSSNEGCIQIIKTGINKGNPCGLASLKDCLCKRHYNLKNKSSVINI
jgi:hypothetical protein